MKKFFLKKYCIYFLFTIIPIFICKFKIDTLTKTIKDEYGRSTIFHGVNIVVKAPPYLPTDEKFDPMTSINIEDIKIMKSLGFNFVRLGVMWEAVEKSEGIYDMDYLLKIKNLINQFGENGIYTEIDIHQDLFSRVFCGEGVPVFYAVKLPLRHKCDENFLSNLLGMIGLCKRINDFNWKYDESGLPIIDSCREDFLSVNQSIELSSAYTAFYENIEGIQDKFLEFLVIIAKYFKGNEFVMGLDVWNEPMPKKMFSDFKNLFPGFADNNYLIPFYRKIYEKLNQIDPQIIYNLEPFPFPDTIPIFGGIFLESFKEAPLGNENLNQQIFNVHSYCCLATPNMCNNLGREPSVEAGKNICKSFHQRKMKQNKEIGLKLGIPTIVTEFGACSDTEACYLELKNFLDAADENLLSWAYWMYKPFNDHTTSAIRDLEGLFYPNGKIQENKEKALSRTYVLSYPGVPLFVEYKENGQYFTEFLLDINVKAPLMLYLNKKKLYKNFVQDFLLKISDDKGNEIPFESQIAKQNNLFLDENYLEINLIKDKLLDKQKLRLQIIFNSK